MKKKKEKIFVIVAAVLVVAVFYYNPVENYLNPFLVDFREVDWDEVLPRNIVTNSIPITLIEETGGKCKVKADTFDLIIDHQYFVRANDLVRELNYDKEDATLMLSCDQLKGEKSRLHVWYVVEESEKHSKKYEYFVTVWNSTLVLP